MRIRLFVNCGAWEPRVREMRKGVSTLASGNTQGRAGLTTTAVLTFLRKMKVGQMLTISPRADAGDGREEVREGGEGGSGGYFGYGWGWRAGLPGLRVQTLCLFFHFCIRSACSFCFSKWGRWEEGERGGATLTAWHCMALRRIAGYMGGELGRKNQQLPWFIWVTYSWININDYTHTSL